MTHDLVVRRHVVVAATLVQAFEVFTHRFDAIKPREHNLLSVPVTQTLLEPHVGGRIVDRGQDGTECAWARILVFEPPHRIVFTWDIGPTWQIENDLAKSSEVEVQFTAEGEDRTRVELEQRLLERHGHGWESLRDAIGDDQGWPLYLARYAELLGGAA